MSPAALLLNQAIVIQPRPPIETLQDLRTAIAAMGGAVRRFAFRGYYVPPEAPPPDPPTALLTGLDRLCEEIDPGRVNALRLEVAIVREFMRRAHHYLPDLPRPGDSFEWLALLQHHGAPTRLLDWTYSPAVAVHFALKHAAYRPEADLAVWVISTEWCMEKSSDVCLAAGKSFSRLREPLQPGTEGAVAGELLSGELPPCVWPINPFRLNERLTLQQGLFLAPGDVRRSFADNLAALSGQTDPANVTYIPIPRAASGALLQELRDANVTDATLFPGLDGFSRSLWGAARFLHLENQSGFHELVDPRGPEGTK